MRNDVVSQSHRSKITIFQRSSGSRRSYKTNSMSRVTNNRSHEIQPASLPRQPAEIMASSWKCDAWKRCLLLFYGGGILARRGDLSLNRFAHRMHSRFLEQRTISQDSIYAAAASTKLRSGYPNSFTYFPLSRKYICVDLLSVLSASLFHLLSYFRFFVLL